jgi:hypothetical protein
MADPTILELITKVQLEPLTIGMATAAKSVSEATDGMAVDFAKLFVDSSQSIDSLSIEIAGLKESIRELATTIEPAMARTRDSVVHNAEEASLSLRELKKEMVELAETAELSATGTVSALGPLGALFGIDIGARYIEKLKEAVLATSRLSSLTGVSVSKLVQFRGSMEELGVPTENLNRVLVHLATSMQMAANGSKEEVVAFEQLGISTDAWSKKLPDTVSVLMQMSDHLHRVKGNSDDAAAAGRVLGQRLGVDLAGGMTVGSKAIEERMEKHKDLGDAMEKTVSDAQRLQEAEVEASVAIQQALVPLIGFFADFLNTSHLLWVGLVSDITEARDVIVASLYSIGTSLEEVFALTAKVATFDFSGAKSVMHSYADDIANEWKQVGNEIEADSKRIAEAIKPIIQPPQLPPQIREPGQAARLAQKEKKTPKDYDPTVTLAQIEADKQVADARLRLQEETIRAAFEAKKISLDQEIALELQTEQELYTANVAAVNREIVLEQSKSAGNQEERDKQKAALIKLHGELEVMEADHQSKMTSIRAEGEKKQTAALKQEMDEQVRRTEESAKGQLSAIERSDEERLKRHQITLQQWAASETDALNKWYEEQKGVMQKWLSAMRAAHQENTQEYQRMIDKLNQLDQQRALQQQKIDQKSAQQFQQVANVMATSFATAFEKMTTTNQKFGKTMQQFWNQLVLGFDKMLAQLLADWIKNVSMRVLQETLGHSKILASLIAHITGTAAVQAAGNATKVAETVATNTAIVTSEAGVAGAEAYAAMVGIPYVGPIIAPAAMATAIATTLSNLSLASAAHGFDVPHLGAEGMLTNIHSREMVLPQRIADNVRSMTSSSSSRGGDVHFHGDQHFHAAPAEKLSMDEFSRMVHAAARKGMIPSGI